MPSGSWLFLPTDRLDRKRLVALERRFDGDALLRPQRGEQDHLADVVDAGEQHRDAVHADAEPARRWHAVFERPQVVLVDDAPICVAGLLGGLLILEPQSLF